MPIAPSVVRASYYDQLGSNSMTAYLPNAKGYLVWSNTAPSQPGTASTCVSGYFPVLTRVGGIRKVGLSELAVSPLVNECGGYAPFMFFLLLILSRSFRPLFLPFFCGIE